MNNRFQFVLVLVLVLVLLSAQALPNDQKEIEALYRRGLTGDKAAVEQCIERLESALQANPTNQLAKVYLGSAYTLRSRDLGFGPAKLSTLQRGIALMNEAVTAAPNDPKIRLARALTTDALPALFGQRATSRKDFEILLQSAETEPEKFEEGDLQIIYYQAGLAAKAASDTTRATLLWHKALTHPDDPSLTAKIRAQLKE